MKTLQTLRKTCSKVVVAGAAMALPWLASTAQAQSTLAKDLVAQWGFDGNYLDGVKNFNGEGRGTTPPVFEAGKAGFGQAVKLDGGNQFVEITGGSEDELEFPGASMSISTWFKVGTFDTEWQALIAKGEGSNYRIARRGTTGTVAYAGGTGEPGQAAPDVNDGAWHHVVAITDHTAGTYLYVDGVMVEENTTLPVLASNAQRLMIGENPDARNREWNGWIDDVGIWKRVLTEAEVKEIYANGTGKALINILPPKIEALGTGAAALLGRDLTDPENDGVDALGAGTDPAGKWNWTSITSSHEPDFEGGENSFNIFDNKVGGGNDKWCCDDPTVDNPVWVAVEFASAVSISRFTVTSGNDSADRDPTDWAIQGSNDGNTYEDIYHFKGTPALWTARNQVLKFTLPLAAKPYKFLRYIAWETPGTLHQLNEVEFFSGTVGYISGVNGGLKTFSFAANDLGPSIIDPATATLTFDGAAAPLVATDTATGASFVHTYAAALVPGSTHTYKIAVKDTSGASINQDGSFTLGLPVFPTANLPALPVTKNQWNIRHIFGAGTITDFATVFAAITNVGKADFVGVSVDGNTSVINYPVAGGFFGNGLEYPAEATGDGAWTGEDFVQFSVGHIEILEAGEYTFGVHSDDGFAFRIRGGELVKVSGNGSVDPVDPEAVLHPANTGDSNTRAVFKLKKGVYRVEFFWWERGGGDNGEFYAAKGNYTNDADTDSWKLVGDPAVSETFQKLGVDEAGWTVIASDAGGDPLNTLADALADLTATGGASKNYDALNIGDPDSNAGVAAWPKDVAGVAEDDFAMKATAMLVVPVTGTYEIGFTGDDGGYMKMPGQIFTEILQNGTGLSVIGPDDTVTCDCLTGSSQTTVKVNLTAGKHPIEIGFFERGGGAFTRAFGAQFGSPQLPTLTKNGAGTFKTPEALHLTVKPVGVEEPKNVYSIGLNFGSDEPNTAKGGTLAANEKAGVPDVAQVNWNNLAVQNGTNIVGIVADREGVAEATGVTLNWVCNNLWSSTGRGEENNEFTGADKKLMTGYLDTAAATRTTVTISGIPATLTEKGYDVYVYALGGVPGRGGSYRIVDTATKAVLRDYIRAKSPTKPAAFAEVPVNLGATNGTGNRTASMIFPDGNYLVFRGLTSPDITIEAATAAAGGGIGYSATPRAPINAIQLVTPQSATEPDDVTSPLDVIVSNNASSRSPAAEQVGNAIDNNLLTKYLNFGTDTDTAAPFVGPVGFTLTSKTGISVVTGLALTSANDAAERDPASYKLEGSSDGVNFTLISEGAVPAFSTRFVRQVITFPNTAAYSSYRLSIPGVFNNATANSMQVAEVELLGRVTVAYPRITSLTRNADGSLTVSWSGGGTLQAAASVNGPWQDVSASSPFTFPADQAATFGRIIKR